MGRASGRSAVGRRRARIHAAHRADARALASGGSGRGTTDRSRAIVAAPGRCGRDRGTDGARLRQHPDRHHRLLGPHSADAPAGLAGGGIRRGDREGRPARHSVHPAAAPVEPQRPGEAQPSLGGRGRGQGRVAAQAAHELEPAGREGSPAVVAAGVARWRAAAGCDRPPDGERDRGEPGRRGDPRLGPDDRALGGRGQDIPGAAGTRQPPPGDRSRIPGWG